MPILQTALASKDRSRPMLRNLTLSLVALAGTALPASAHPGHLAGLAGHDHWVAGAAIGAAVAAGIWAALKGRRKPQSDADSAENPKPQEA